MTAQTQWKETFETLQTQMTNLLITLQQENEFIRKNDINQLTLTIKQKMVLIDRIKTFETTVMKPGSFENKVGQLQQMVTTELADQPDVLHSWNNILKLAAQCHQLNLVNGMALNNQFNRYRKLLDTLTYPLNQTYSQTGKLG